MNSRKKDFDYLNKVVPLILLVVIFFFAAWIRFDGITEQGIRGGDTFKYLKEAKLWATGKPPQFMRRHFRPVTYFLGGMAIRIFGYNDYSIKIMHGIMDLVSIFLIFLIAYILAKNFWVGLVSSLIYSFLPKIVYYVRSEDTHVESTFFVLMALFFFILFDKRKKKDTKMYLLLFFSGLNSGLAANTHPELVFLGPGYVLYLFIKNYDSKNKKKSFKEILLLSLIFSFSFLLPYLLCFVLFGIKNVWKVFFSIPSSIFHRMFSATTFGDYLVAKINIFCGIFFHLIKFYFSNQFLLVSVLLFGTIPIMIYRGKKKEMDRIILYLPLILLFVYSLFFAFFFKHLYNPITQGRILMPFIPMIVFILTQWYFRFLKKLLGKYSLIAFVSLFFILFLINPKVIPGTTIFKSKSFYRLTFDFLKDEVNSKNRLLIAPLTVDTYYWDGLGFQCDLYFGDNAIYLRNLPINGEYNLSTLKEMLNNKNVRYIFVSKKAPKPGIYFSGKKYDAWLRNPKFTYSVEKDLKIIQNYIQSEGGMVIKKNHFGKIYYLNHKGHTIKTNNLIKNGSFEHWFKEFPTGEWQLLRGSISRSGEASDGLYSMYLEPNHADNKHGTRMIYTFRNPSYPDGSELKLRISMDAKSDEPNRLLFFVQQKIAGKWNWVEPKIVRYSGKGEWMTLSGDFLIPPDIETVLFGILLNAGAKECGYVDNVSIEIVD